MRVLPVFFFVVLLLGAGSAWWFFSHPFQNENAESSSQRSDFFQAERNPTGREAVVPVRAATSTPFSYETTDAITVSGVLYPLPTTTPPVRNYSDDEYLSLDTADISILADARTTDGEVRFQIFYDYHDSIYIIILGSEPLRDVRLEAERALRQALQADEEVLCRLPILVEVPGFVNAFYARKNVGLSFCNGLPL